MALGLVLCLQVWLVKLADVESPEEAALLRGHTLLIPASAREALEDEDEFYVQVGGAGWAGGRAAGDRGRGKGREHAAGTGPGCGSARFCNGRAAT